MLGIKDKLSCNFSVQRSGFCSIQYFSFTQDTIFLCIYFNVAFTISLTKRNHQYFNHQLVNTDEP